MYALQCHTLHYCTLSLLPIALHYATAPLDALDTRRAKRLHAKLSVQFNSFSNDWSDTN